MNRPAIAISGNVEYMLHQLRLKKVFRIFSRSETTGTDLSLPPQARMIMTLGEGVTMSGAIQALMRDRDFLKPFINPELMHSVLWVGPEQLRNQILNEVGADSVAACLNWSIIREAAKLEHAVLLRAYQEIEFIVRNIVANKLQQELYYPVKQIEIFHTHLRAFWYTLGRDPVAIYGQRTKFVATKNGLWDHAKEFARQANITLTDYPLANFDLEQIINQTAQILETIPQLKGEFLSTMSIQQAEQFAQNEQVTQQEIDQNQITASVHKIDLMTAESEKYAKNELRLDSELLNEPNSKFHFPAHKLILQAHFLSKNLYIMKNWVYTLKAGLNNDYFRAKPIDYFLILKDDKGLRAFVLARCDAVEYLHQLQNPENISRKAALFSSLGFIVQNGKSSQAFLDEELLKFKDWIKELVMNIGLLCGRVRHPELIKKIIRENKADLEIFWDYICKKAIFLDDLDTLKMQNLLLNENL